MNKKISLKELIFKLDEEGYPLHLEEAKKELEENKGEGDEESWYIKLAVGGVAWFSALLFISGIFTTMWEVMLTAPSLLVWASLIVVGSFNLKDKSSLFLKQLALALLFISKIMFLLGVGYLFEFEAIVLISCIMIFIEFLFFYFYEGSANRFLFPLTTTIFLLIISSDLSLYNSIHLIVLLLLITIILMLKFELKLRAKVLEYKEIFAGTIVSFLSILILSINSFTEVNNWYLSSSFILIATLILIYRIIIQLEFKKGNLIFALLGVSLILVTLFTYNSPGVLASIFVILVAFFNRSNALLSLAILFLSIYIIIFYYSLEITLLYKSFSLLGVASVLLILRYSLKGFKKRVLR